MAPLTATRPTVARVDLAALQANVRAVAEHLEARSRVLDRRPPGIIAVVKANAYGHGAVRSALAFEAAGAHLLACADVEEGVVLREGGVRSPILVFGALGVSDLGGVFSHDLTPTISTPSAAAALERAAAERGVRLSCHLKIDTGMHRLGFRDENLAWTIPPILRSPHLAVEAVYTHFGTADSPEQGLFADQQARFARARTALQAIGLGPVKWHAANSAACLRSEATWFDYVRPGLALYGIVPPPLAPPLSLTPALRLTSRVVAVKGLRPGESVGYGASYVAPSARQMAVVPAGYADGLDVRLAGRGHVLVRGCRAPVIGSVCMDMVTIDVTDLGVEPGDEVVIVGPQGRDHIDVRQVAAAIGTIPYELLCRVGSRIERVYDQ
ncbi:MAG: alanine racemase [Vicinamibacterales bacterium]